MISSSVAVFSTILILHLTSPTQANNCTISCGRNQQCTLVENQPVCSCRTGYVQNSQKICVRVECSTNSECRLNQKCSNQLCINSCIGVCGTNAICFVRDHIPVCTCPPRTTGDPFVACLRTSTLDCETNSDCGSQFACIRFKCRDPCTQCGRKAECTVVNHLPSCTCPPGYTGNPFEFCRRL